MNTRTKTLAASILTAAVLLPTAAADAKLGGSPQMFLTDSTHARLHFAADKAPTRVTFAGGTRKAATAKKVGTHGSDRVYDAKVTSKNAMVVGAKYTVTFTFADGTKQTRSVKLYAEK